MQNLPEKEDILIILFLNSHYSDAENSETQSWLEYVFACEYINQEVFDSLTSKSLEVEKLLNYRMTNPDKFN